MSVPLSFSVQCVYAERESRKTFARCEEFFHFIQNRFVFPTQQTQTTAREKEREREKRRRKAREEDTSSVVVVVMDVPDDWGIVANDDDDDDGKKKRWLTPNTTAARNHLVKAKTTNKKKEKGEEREREQSEGKVISGRLLGRRRRAKEKRKRMATNRKTTRKNDGGGSSADEEEEEKEEKEEEKRERRTNANMTEKQKKKAEKNRARKLRREWKRKKEMEEEEEEEEEKKARVEHNPDEEERNEMKRLAKEYVAEKARKKRAKITTTKGDEKRDNRSNSNSESSEKNEDEGEESESEDDVAQQRREREREREQQQPAVKKQKKLSLIDKMRAKLSGGHFRMLNEQLYTTKGDEALHLVQQNPGVFDAYHEGFREQVKKWPKNPVHKCFEWLQHKPYDTIIADFGCGDAELAKLIGKSKKKVYSLDLETPSHAPFVIACNMAKTPLESNSVDVAVFSLSLMGTDYYKFIEEASRVLKVKGKLWIAEVKSRFDGRNGAASIPSFVASLKTAGFDVDPKKVDEKDKMFFVLEAVKAKNHASSSSAGSEKKNNKSGKVEWPKLKACEYKKR